MRSETNVSDGEVKNQNLRKELWKIYSSTPRSTWFTEIKCFEMKVQEIAFLTAFCWFPHLYMWENGLLLQPGKLSRNLISESTLETQSFTDKDRKQKVRQKTESKKTLLHLCFCLCPSPNLQPVCFLVLKTLVSEMDFLLSLNTKERFPLPSTTDNSICTLERTKMWNEKGYAEELGM